MRKKCKIVIMMLYIAGFLMASCSDQKDAGKFKWEQIDTSVGFLGNSPANHANGGGVCKSGNGIYFSNPYENGYLYKALPDGSEKELVLEAPCRNINVVGDVIFYQSEKDHSIRTYCISDGKEGILVADPVEDMVVTSDAVYFISNTIEKISLDGRQRKQLMPEGDYFYLDVYGDHLFYTLMEEQVNLYVADNRGEHTELLLEGAKGAVVIEDTIFYTGVDDDMLYCYNARNQTKTLIDEGYNANIWKDNIFYIKENRLYCCADGVSTDILQDYFGQMDGSYVLEAYYIVDDSIYVNYSIHADGDDYNEMIAVDLADGNTVKE